MVNLPTQRPKDWKSTDEQVEIIKSRGMVIHDEDEARHFLNRLGYYRLSGYWYPFRKLDNTSHIRLDAFIEGSQFSDVIGLYLFDRKLRLLALDAIERIELAVQVEVAHRVGARDAFAHENPLELHGNFSRKKNHLKPSRHEHWLDGYDSLVTRSKRKTFVAHNLRKYGRLPIWVAIEVFDFGCLSKLYSGLKIQDRIEIERQFGLNEGKHLQTWLRSLNFIRNMAAHHSRLWNCNVLDTASIPRQKTLLFNLNNTRPFLYFCIMQSILKVVAPKSDWGNRFIELTKTFPDVENSAVKLSDMGTVKGWETWKLWT